MKQIIVLRIFVDKDDNSIMYNVGDKPEGFDEARINQLIERGLVKAVDPKEVDLSGNHKSVVAQIKECENVESLQNNLKMETESEKPRAGVTTALKERIAILSK